MLSAFGIKGPPQIDAGGSNNGTVGDASVRAVIPNRADGTAAKYIMVASTVATYFDAGDSGVTATPDGIILGANEVYFFNVAGKTNYAHLQVSGAGVISVSPLENQ